MRSEDLARRISEVRERAGLNNREFAKELWVSPAYVTMLEHGTRNDWRPVIPSRKFLTLLCLKFGVDVVWMTSGHGDPVRTPRQELIQKVWMLLDNEVSAVREVVDVLERHGGVGKP